MDYVKIGEVGIALPALVQWREAIASGQLNGSPLVSPEVTSSWLDRYSPVSCAVLGAWQHHDKCWSIPLLRLKDTLYPVHFEDVICNHCKKRCGLSACPDTTSLWWPGSTVASAWALFKDLPVLHCPHCQSILRHRQTIWFAAPNQSFEADGYAAAQFQR